MLIKLLRRMGLAPRVLLMIALATVGLLTVNDYVIAKRYEQTAFKQMQQRAQALTVGAEETQSYISFLHQQGAFATEDMEKDIKEVMAKGGNYRDTRFFESVPVIGGMSSAHDAAAKAGLTLDVMSLNARNPKHQPKSGSLEETLMQDLVAQVNASDGKEQDLMLSHVDRDTKTLHVFRAIRLTPDCLSCHGDPATSPNGDGTDLVGFPMENMKAGDVHGAYHVAMSTAPIAEQAAGFVLGGLTWTAPLMLVGALPFIWLVRATVSRPVRETMAQVERLGEGDLTVVLSEEGNDELAQINRALNTAFGHVNDLVCAVRGASVQVADASKQIADCSHEMAEGLDCQKQNIKHLADSAHTTSVAIQSMAGEAGEAKRSAGDAGQAARDGSHVVKQTVEAMQQIDEDVTRCAQMIDQLGERSQQIGQIISVIDDIADQTNLLALNAAIESARAGEHGRGFAVVADEVRKLADRTTQATAQIAEYIKQIQADTDVANKQMQSGTQRVKQGVHQADEAGQRLQQILSHTESVNRRIEQIAERADTQGRSSQAVSQSVSSVASAVTEASHNARESSTVVNMLAHKAEQLSKLVDRFTIREVDRRKNCRPLAPGETDRRVHPETAADDLSRVIAQSLEQTQKQAAQAEKDLLQLSGKM